MRKKKCLGCYTGSGGVRFVVKTSKTLIRDGPLENLRGGGGGGGGAGEEQKKYSRKGKLNEKTFMHAH